MVIPQLLLKTELSKSNGIYKVNKQSIGGRYGKLWAFGVI